MTYLAINLQPGNGLSAFSNIKEAQSKKDSAESNLDVVRKEIADSIRIDWFKVQSVRAEIDIYKKLIDATKRDYESSVRLYAAGRKGWMDVLNFRKEATTAKYHLADAEWGGFLATMKLKINSGTISEYLSILDKGDPSGI
jgi:outer membrane protein TolC